MQWGPGTLAGRALLAVGEVTLRAAERIIILRRLAVIRSYLTCLKEDGVAAVSSSYVEKMFDDILELSRWAFVLSVAFVSHLWN